MSKHLRMQNIYFTLKLQEHIKIRKIELFVYENIGVKQTTTMSPTTALLHRLCYTATTKKNCSSHIENNLPR